MLTNKDKSVIRALASEIADNAALPINEDKRRLWRKLNAKQADRPMVMIDQVCWNEMNTNGDLTLQTEDAECRRYEDFFRKTLYQWRHFPVDMVIEPFIRVPMAIQNTGFGIGVHEETTTFDPENSVISHKYENQFKTDEDLDKIKTPVVSNDQTETDRRLSVAHELFDGIIEVRPWGADPYLSIWDPVSTWMGVQDALFTIVDRPDYMREIARRMTDGYLSLLDQLESQGLLAGPQSLIHCTGAWTDELPAPGYNPLKPRTKDMWMFGLAQMFSSVSPKMFKTFEIDFTSRICERFGLVYYGCCDPLDGKMKEVRLLPNVRKISMSPWANETRGAERIGRDYVFSRKPNPAHVAMTRFDADLIEKDLTATRDVCNANGCSLEYILKDISTVGYEPDRLDKWASIAMKVVGA
ncbi:MAG: hypothetical protein ABIH86_02535 [Planctomycetota bacterium]